MVASPWCWFGASVFRRLEAAVERNNRGGGAKTRMPDAAAAGWGGRRGRCKPSGRGRSDHLRTRWPTVLATVLQRAASSGSMAGSAATSWSS